MNRLLCLLLLIPAIYAQSSDIWRPCSKDNYACIGSFLAVNSFCNAQVSGAIPSNYTIPKYYFEASFFNATYMDADLTIKNHNKCYVSQFYYNRATKVIVLAIRCPGLIFQSTRTLFQHYPEREDIVYNFDYNGTYPEVIVTVNIPYANGFNICTTPAYAYVTALPTFSISPNDKPTDEFLSTDLTYFNIYEREAFSTRAYELIRYFINSMLCNFGCDF